VVFLFVLKKEERDGRRGRIVAVAAYIARKHVYYASEFRNTCMMLAGQKANITT
jgi:hypothetical protein